MREHGGVGYRRRLTPAEYVDGVLSGDRYKLARAITLVESTGAADADLALEVIEACLPHTGGARRIGVTGVPGAGKSTFLETLGLYLARECGESLAVLSIDPSSPVTGGSILGDKTRMERLAMDERAFIRPSPSSGQLGGVARRTRETMLLCEAAGYRNVFVETVGVGQSEVAVRGMVDTFLLLALAGAGDELQGIKRGITEITDIIAVHKADGDGLRAAQRAKAELQLAMHLFPKGEDGWPARVLTCSSHSGDGIREVWDTVLEHQETLRASGFFATRRQRQSTDWLHEAIRGALEEQFFSDEAVQRELPGLEAGVRAGTASATRAARRLLALYNRKE
ncbi:MAG: methylmalonyl Co-A mutase-associated GTPase MeaB [Bryobacterales bacterium]|nr:methylmalonyl Co-A mutase-associated GTPase MeaB [Bryobacterales bacterium]